MVSTPTTDDKARLDQIISALEDADQEARLRLMEAAAIYLGIPLRGQGSTGRLTHAIPSRELAAPTGAFSDHREMSPKEFLLEKQPNTDVERVACLAFYLVHYRDKKQFETLDISKLNTEAAQPKFSNATVSVRNATTYGYLAAGSRGNKQVSAAGEQFVLALPDRGAAKGAMNRMRPKRRMGTARKRKKASKKS